MHDSKWLKIITFPPVLIILLVVFANFLFLTQIFNPNPLITRSGLSNNIKSGIFSGYHDIDPNDGFTTQSLGKLSADDILRGHVPWWNYNEQVGAPLAGEMQSAALFPLTLLMYFNNGVVYFYMILEIIAGTSTYFLLRKLKLRKISSFLGGGTFAISSVFVWFWSANTNPIAFLPLLILGIETAYLNTKNKKNGGIWIIAIALALSLYAGFPEVAFLDGLVALCWTILRFYQLDYRLRFSYFKKIFFGGSSGLLLAAPVLIAFVDYLPYANLGPHSGLMLASLNYIGIPALFMPYVYGPIFGFTSYDMTNNLNNWWGNVGGYVTTLAIFFVSVGVFCDIKVKTNKRALKIMLLAIALIVFARIYGYPGISNLLATIPGIGIVAIYRYSQPALVFCLVILMAYGFNWIIDIKNVSSGRDYLNKVRLPVILTLFILILIIPIANHEYNRIITAPNVNYWFYLSIIWAFLSVFFALILILSLYKKLLPYKINIYLLASLILFDALLMFIVPQFSAPRSGSIDIKPIIYLRQHIGDYRFYSLGPIMPNYSSYYGLSSIDTNNMPISKNWSKYVTRYLDSNANPLTFTGVNSISMVGISPINAFINNIKNYEYIGVKYLVVQPESLNSDQIKGLNLKLVYQDKVAEIYRLPSPDPYFQIIKGKCSITTVYSKNSILLNCLTPSTLLRRELYMPGWVVSLNNKASAVHQSGPLFQSVSLPIGKSKLEFNFTPKHIEIGYIAFICGLLMIAGIYFINRKK